MKAGARVLGAALALATAFGSAGELREAPPFALTSADGRTVAFPADAQGRPAVLLFWATWCPYSGALMPHLREIREDYVDRDVRVWAVNIREDGDPVAFMERRGLDFVLLLDGDEVADRYGVKGTPGLMVVDGGGNIVYARAPTEERPKKIAKVWAREVREALDAALAAAPAP